MLKLARKWVNSFSFVLKKCSENKLLLYQMFKGEEQLQNALVIEQACVHFVNKRASVLLHMELFAHAEIGTSARQQPPCIRTVLSSAYPISK